MCALESSSSASGEISEQYPRTDFPLDQSWGEDAPALDGASHYCVSTATLVSPRTAPVLSVNCTKMRLLAGSNATVPLADTKMPKGGVALPAIVVAAVG